MDKRTAIKAYQIQLEVAYDKIVRATRLVGSINSDKEWKEFDDTCKEADALVFNALCCVALKNLVPESEEKKLIASLKQLHVNRIEACINWNMLWREREAIANPQGKYGIMRARRLKMEAALQDDDGDGHHDPKP